MLGRGLKLVDGNDSEWELNQLLFADDTVVVADSERKLCQLVTEFGGGGGGGGVREGSYE